MIKALRGMKDITHTMGKKYQQFMEVATRVATNFGFDFIQTPILEETSLFIRSVGDSSDIVNKEMYRFSDKGDHDVCLRPENTAGVVRSFIEQKLDRVGGVHRFFCYGPMFRYERPQKGRYRQFNQFDCEVFGCASAVEEALLIVMLSQLFDALDVSYTVEINSLGCKTCSSDYKHLLKKSLLSQKEAFCTDCHIRIDTNPMRVFDCKQERCQTLVNQLPLMSDHLCNACQDHFDTLQQALQEQSISFVINKRLVRGLDYYNRSVFEFVTDLAGAQNTIAGGGRYDYLVEYLGGKPSYGVGFALGIDRVLDLMAYTPKREGIYIGAIVDEALSKVIQIGIQKRKNCRVHIDYERKKLQQHLKKADKLQAIYCVVIGEDELKNAEVWIKDLQKQTTSTISIDDFLSSVTL